MWGVVVGYVAPRALLWAMRGFGQHTLLGIIRSDVGRLQNNLFKKIIVKVEVSVFVSPPKLLKRIKSHGTASLFPK
jgi:hypothetical protein